MASKKASQTEEAPEDQYTRKLGLVDAGSGTIRLVIYGVTAEGELKKVFTEQSQCNLGEGVARNGKLSSKSVECVIDNLKKFRETAEAENVDEFHVFATAAVREAKNQKDFLKAVKSEAGLDVEVLSGKKEAQLAAIGASYGLGLSEVRMSADLGRTSLDIARLSKKSAPSKPKSLLLGSSEVLARGDKSGEYIDLQLDELNPRYPKGKKLHLVGGTWRALAKGYLRSKGEDHKDDLHGYQISTAEFDEFLQTVENSDEQTLLEEFKIPEHRLKHLPAAIETLRKLTDRLKTPGLVFSQFGVREGFVLSELLNKKAKAEVASFVHPNAETSAPEPAQKAA